MAKKEKYRYQLVHVWGGVEPCFWGKAGTWEHLEKCILNLLRADEYKEGESGIFFVRLTKSGRPKDICSFSSGFMDEMREKAEAKMEKSHGK